MQVEDMVVLVTGANRGLGRAIAAAALAAGARKVYAGARNPESVDLPGVIPVRLDVTDPQQAAQAAADCEDVNVLVNNAGIARGSLLLAPEAGQALRAELETNLYGPLLVARAFAPQLTRAGRGRAAVVNVLSALSWFNIPGASTYCVSKSAAWGLTNGLRNELRPQGVQVIAVHVGYMDTDMTSDVPVEKADPRDVARQILAALQSGREEVLADETSRKVKASLSEDRAPYLLSNL